MFFLFFFILLIWAGCTDINISVPYEKSSNAALKSLSIKNSNGELIKSFDISMTPYIITVPYSTEYVIITAEPVDERANINIPGLTEAGSFYLNVGENTIAIIVTAEDGAIQEYTVTVTPEGYMQVVVFFSEIYDEKIDLTPDHTKDISRKNEDVLHITVTGDFDPLPYQWFMDDADLAETGDSMAISAVNYLPGRHSLSVMVYKNGIPYLKELIFTVVR
jgi:hypothetical protein